MTNICLLGYGPREMVALGFEYHCIGWGGVSGPPNGNGAAELWRHSLASARFYLVTPAPHRVLTWEEGQFGRFAAVP